LENDKKKAVRGVLEHLKSTEATLISHMDR